VVKLRDGVGRADRRHRNAQRTGSFDDLSGGPLGGPLPYGCAEFVAATQPAGEAREVGVVEPVEAFDQQQKVLKLLAGNGAKPHVAIGRRLDRRKLQRAGRHPVHGIDLGSNDAQAAHRDRHGLQQGDVNEFTASPGLRTARVSNRRDGRVSAADPLTQTTTGRQRATSNYPSTTRRAAACLQRELRGGSRGPGSGAPVWSDGNNDIRVSAEEH
jgi:hypothetical protein